MNVTIVPTICEASEDGTPANYNGHVILRMPDAEERMGILEAYGIEIEDGDDEKTITKKVASRGNLQLLRFLIRQLPHWVVEVAIKRLDDGYEFKTWDDVRYDTEVGVVASELAWRLTGKYRVGNGSAPS